MSVRVDHIQEQAARPAQTAGRTARARVRSWVASCLLVDVAMLATAGAIATISSRSPQPITLPWMTFYAAVTIAGLAAFRGYAPRLRLEILEELRAVLTATAVAAMTLIAVHEVTAADQIDGSEAVRLWGYSCVYLAAGRAGLVVAWRRAELADRRDDHVIVGAGRVGRLTAIRLLDHPEFGLHPIGFLDAEPMEITGDGRCRSPCSATSGNLAASSRRTVSSARSSRSPRTRTTTCSTCSTSASGSAFARSIVPRLFERVPSRLAGDARRRAPAARAPADEPAQHPVRGQVRDRPRSRRSRSSSSSRRSSSSLTVAVARLARPADPLPTGSREPRRPALQHAQVPDDGARTRAARRRRHERFDPEVAPGGSRERIAGPVSARSCGAGRSTSYLSS